MKGVARHFFSRHTVLWARQSLRLQEGFHARARSEAAVKRAELENEVDVIEAMLKELGTKVENDKACTPPLSMSAAALGEEYLVSISSMIMSPGFRSKESLKASRSVALACPWPWSNQYVRTLAKHTVWQPVEPSVPTWAKQLVRDRDFFSGNALVVRGAGGQEEAWKMLYMVKAPNFYMAVCPLREAPANDVMMEGESMSGYMDRFTLRSYKCNYADMRTASDIVVADTSKLFVVFGLNHDGGVHLSSQEEPMPLEVFTYGDQAVVPDVVAGDEGDSTKCKGDDAHWDKLIQEFPWLTCLDVRSGFAGDDVGGQTKKKARAHHNPDEMFDDAVDEDAVLDGLAEMERARAACELEFDRKEKAFFVVARGGESTLAATGHLHDAVQAKTTDKKYVGARDWCRRRSLQVTFKATINSPLSLYSAEQGNILVRSWCHRMQHFFDMECNSGLGEDYEYGPDVVGAYEEPSELSALADALPGKAQERIAFIWSIPRLNLR